MKKLSTSLLLLFTLSALVLPQDLLGGSAKVGGQGVVRRAAAGGGSTLNTSLVGYWKFDESSGDAADSSGASLTLTNNNTATFGAGKVGNAAYLASASSQFFSRASSAPLQFGGSKDWSMAGWGYLTADIDNPIIVSKDNENAGRRELNLFVRAGAPNYFSVAHFTSVDVETYRDASTFGAPAVTTWIFISITYTNSTDALTISVNGGARDTTTVVLQAPSDAEFRIGGRQYTGFLNPLNGRVDEWGKWDKAITTTEEACLYNSGNGATYPFSGLCP